jgi:hypothetical protein
MKTNHWRLDCTRCRANHIDYQRPTPDWETSKRWKYKVLVGAVGHDGKVSSFPQIQINPETDEAKEVGRNMRELEHIHDNKWQNRFTLSDDCILGILLKSKSVLRGVTKKLTKGEIISYWRIDTYSYSR